MKGLKWGVLIGSVIMVLALFGPSLYHLLSPHSLEPPSWPRSAIVSAFLWYGGWIIAGIVAGAITRGSIRKNVLAGTLCAIPATVVYLYVEVAYKGEGIIPPVMLVLMAGSGAIGGLISYGIQSLKRLAK
jgi:hypothetical protein